MDSTLAVYLPMDRRHALARAETLPNRTEGAALFADISGFTPLTEALTNALGPRRGAEELPRQLNLVYDALIREVDRHGGSVIGFAGDAITCWFDGDNGLVALTCALAMQKAMRPFARVTLPSGERAALSMKVGVASGPVRRFLVGEPGIQLIDVLAGETLRLMAAAEQQAHKRELLADEQTLQRLGAAVTVKVWRVDKGGARFGVVTGVSLPVLPQPWPPLAVDALTEAVLRPWLPPVVYERLQAGQGEFLTELRPAVALFLHFAGIDYDGDEAAGEKLDAYIRWVQAVLTRYEGTLIQLTIGEKGSYLYAAFGAPIAHEDDARRAVASALELREPPPELDFIHSIQVGISRGTMRTGAYGGSTRRTYGVLGDEVNLAARLMQQAEPGQVLASGRVHQATRDRFTWQALRAIRVKGKAEPIPRFALLGLRPRATIRLQEPHYALPMVGRGAELALVTSKMALALQGQGQVVGIVGPAGMGKSRLVAEIIPLASQQGLAGYGGECQSYGINTPYLVWQSIWRGFFDLDPTQPVEEQAQQLSRQLSQVDPNLLPRLPLLAPVLNLPLPENDLTQGLEAARRKSFREGLLVELLKARAQALRSTGSALLLVLEDCQWLDPLSHDLLESVGRAIAGLPVLLILAYRPVDLARLQAPRVASLAHFTEVSLQELVPEEAEQLLRAKLAHLGVSGGEGVPAETVSYLMERAQGNPFYLEELLNYLQDQGLDPRNLEALRAIDLPASLHSLILSRIDQLSEQQKITLKVASVIGRTFRFVWLLGYYPALGAPPQVRNSLDILSQQELTPLDQAEPELIYLFKHIITQEVAYESLAYATRAALHEQLARYLEMQMGEAVEQYLDLLAHHYERSDNLPKKCEYLERAGSAAQLAYANEAALDYYERLLPLLAEVERQGQILLRLGEVMDLVGRWEEARSRYERALALTDALKEEQPWAATLCANCQRAIGGVLHKQGNYPEAREWLGRSRASFEAQGDRAGLSQVLSEIGITFWNQADYDTATGPLLESLALARELGDHRSMGYTLRQLGNIAFLRGDYPLARSRYEESVAAARVAGDRLNTASTLCNLGLVAYTHEADFVRARDFYEESLGLVRKIGDKNLLSTLLVNLGSMLTEQGQYPEAERFFREGLVVVREIDNRRNLANGLMNLGRILCAQRQFEEARAVLEEGIEVAQQIGVKWDIVLGKLNLGEMAYLQGDLVAAQTYLEESLALGQEIGVKRNVSQALGKLGLVALARGERQAARQYLVESMAVAQEMGRQQQVLHLLSGLAAVAWQAGRTEARAARLVRLASVAESRLQGLGAALEPAQGVAQARFVAEARALLGEDSFAAVWAAGQTMALEEAIAEALAASEEGAEDHGSPG